MFSYKILWEVLQVFTWDTLFVLVQDYSTCFSPLLWLFCAHIIIETKEKIVRSTASGLSYFYFSKAGSSIFCIIFVQSFDALIHLTLTGCHWAPAIASLVLRICQKS